MSTPAFSHTVHFASTDDATSDAAAEFLLEGHAAGEPLVLIATAGRLEAVAARLAARGFDFDAACAAGQATFQDAHAALGGFMVGELPDERRFFASMQKVLQRTGVTDEGTRVRAYGEMVDLLCQAGNHEGAIRVEDLWNTLGRKQPLNLLCGYAIGNLHRESNGGIFHRICRSHSHIIEQSADPV